MTNSSKKKIRGWKRRIGRVDSWFEKSRLPDIKSFQSRGEDYVKIRIDPWDRLCERVPPSWYFRQIIARLIDIHDEWKKAYSGLNQPFDLQIWLNDPNTIRSQVVCASVDQWGEQRNNYYRASKDKVSVPIGKWGSDRYDLSRFEWKLFDDEDLSFKNIEGLEENEIEKLKRMGYCEEQTVVNNHPETMYARKVGHVWVGREK